MVRSRVECGNKQKRPPSKDIDRPVGGECTLRSSHPCKGNRRQFRVDASVNSLKRAWVQDPCLANHTLPGGEVRVAMDVEDTVPLLCPQAAENRFKEKIQQFNNFMN